MPADPVQHFIPLTRPNGRRSFPVLVVAAVLVALAAPSAAQVSELVLAGLAGGQLSESELGEGVTIAVVWASWSPRCRDVVSRVNALGERWGGQARVITVVFQEEADTVQSFLEGQDLRAPVYLDSAGAFSKKHAVTTLPGLLVIRDGIDRFRGKLPVDPDRLIEQTLR